MKNLFTLLAVALGLVSVAHGASIPFSPELENRLQTDAAGSPYNLKHTVKAVFDAALAGSTGANSGTEYTLPITMPNGALVTNAYMYINTTLTDNGGVSGLYDVYCGTYGALGVTFLKHQYLKQYAGTTGQVLYLPAGVSGTATNTVGGDFIEVGSSGPCSIRTRMDNVGTTGVTSGKWTLYLEYILNN